MPGVLDADFPWTDEQRRVIQNHDGPLQVVACAGSGKTHTVSARIAQMVHDGVDRDKILAFTFGENAAEELKVRIREWMQRADLEDESLGEMFVNTIHSFCQEEILNEHREETLNHDVLNDNELAAFISKHSNDLGLWDLPRGHKYEKIKWFIEDINTIRRELIVEDLATSDDEHAPELMEAYYAYRQLMDEYHFYDYQELIYRAVRLLRRDSEVLAEVREQYEYIIVDEYQDINPAQAELIDLISGDDPNLCVVGDDDQSIYGWRGARPEDFRAFTDRYGGDQEILSENHRCSEMIVDIAQEFVEQNDDRLDKPMESDNPFDVGDVYQHYFDHEHDEVAFIADRIEELHGTVYENPSGEETTLRYGDVGILLRKKTHMQEVQRELDERGVPYTIRGKSSVFENPTAGLIRLAFAYVACGLEDNDDAYIYDQPLEIWDPDSEPPGSGDDEYFVVTEDLLRREIRVNPDLRDREDEIIEKLDERQDWYRDPTSRRIEPQTELHEILRAFGIADPDGDGVDLNAEAFEESVMYNIGQISELVKDFETVYEIIFPDQLQELVDFLDYSYYNSRSEIEDPTLVDAVDLLTIHSVKGLQYPAVFIPGLTTTKFDYTPPRGFFRRQEWVPQDVFDYDDYQASTEEERRLLYVAMTRAQKYLALTGARNNVGYTQRQNESTYYREIESQNHPGVMRSTEPDPTPRERRDIPAGPQDYIYPTSFSDLRYYQKCPYDYKLRKIYQFAPPIDQSLGFGFAVHDLLREMHERQEDESLPMSVGEVRTAVHDEDRFYLRYAEGEIEDNLRNAAEEMLVDYCEDYQDELENTYRSEVPFEILLSDDDSNGTALVSGSIDLLERRDPETEEIVEVDIVDFKTSDEPDREEEDEELRDHRFQVKLYGLATKAEFDLDAVDGYIHYLSKEDNERIPVDLSDPEIQLVRVHVQNIVDQIMDRQFFADPEPDKCGDCDFETICPHAADD